jgi:hypothetical protein
MNPGMITATLSFRAIECKYIGPTNFRGSRISVKFSDGYGIRIVKNWDSSLSPDENYMEAAKEFIVRTKMGIAFPIELVGGSTRNGAIFVMRYVK